MKTKTSETYKSCGQQRKIMHTVHCLPVRLTWMHRHWPQHFCGSMIRHNSKEHGRETVLTQTSYFLERAMPPTPTEKFLQIRILVPIRIRRVLRHKVICSTDIIKLLSSLSGAQAANRYQDECSARRQSEFHIAYTLASNGV